MSVHHPICDQTTGGRIFSEVVLVVVVVVVVLLCSHLHFFKLLPVVYSSTQEAVNYVLLLSSKHKVKPPADDMP
jgi:hypothetical protein